MTFFRALIVLHRTYSRWPAGPRLHAFIRFMTCPFLRALRAVPRGTRSLLEIGAGHAVFSTLAAAAGVARVVAAEPDVRKVNAISPVRFVAGYDGAIRGTFDVVAIVDVLYTMPLGEWDRVLASCVSRLAPGGTLIVKEQDPTAVLKNGWNRIQEWFAQRVLRVTMAAAFSYEPPPLFAARLASHGLSVTWKRIDFGYPHPHVLYVGTKGVESAAHSASLRSARS